MDLYKQLFDHMSEEHGVILLESEMDEIVKIVMDSFITKDYQLFRQVKIEDRLPKKKDEYMTDIGKLLFYPEGMLWFVEYSGGNMLQLSPFQKVTYWMEPIHNT